MVSAVPSVLVAVASYGVAQDHYLGRLLGEYRKLRVPTRIVVLSNTSEKDARGAEVRVGLPSPNPYSLPFAHRELFREFSDQYDLFIYSEDDTLISERHIEAFLQAQSKLQEDEIVGFIRSETNPNGQQFITSIHHHFRWDPQSVVERGGELFASLTNQHSGCFIATRKQLRKAIDSGGFLVPPHAERYGMLETAASDLYTQCGLRRMISLSNIQDFVVPHLPNKYYLHLGIPLEELELQVQALKDLWESQGWLGKLFEPCSGARGFRWSKDLYERADEQFLAAIPATARKVLSVGCGSGANERRLIEKGVDVWAVPLDAVFGAGLAESGVRVVSGPFDQAMDRLGREKFDVVLIHNVLHLLESPVAWLGLLGGRLTIDGYLIASVPNTQEASAWLSDRRTGGHGGQVQVVNPGRLRQWCKFAGLRTLSVKADLDGTRKPMRRMASALCGSLFAPRFILTASR